MNINSSNKFRSDYKKVKLLKSDGQTIDCIINYNKVDHDVLLYTNSRLGEENICCYDNTYKYVFFDLLYTSEKFEKIFDVNFEAQDAEEIYEHLKYTYIYSYAFIGMDEINHNDNLLNSISVNYSFLKDWLYNGDMISSTINSITVEPREYRIKTEKYDIILKIKCDTPNYSYANANDITIKFYSEVTFVYNSPQEFNKCLKDIENLRKFLVFHFDEHVDVSEGFGEYQNKLFNISYLQFKNNIYDKHLNYHGLNKINNFPGIEKLENMYKLYLENCKKIKYNSVFSIFSNSLVKAKEVPEVTFLLCMRCIETIVTDFIYTKAEIMQIIKEKNLENNTIGATVLKEILVNLNDSSNKGYNWLKTKLYILLYMSMTDFKYDYFFQTIIHIFKLKDITNAIDYMVDYRNECAHTSKNKVPVPIKHYFDTVCYFLCKVMIGSELLNMDSKKLYKKYRYTLPRYTRKFNLDDFANQ